MTNQPTNQHCLLYRQIPPASGTEAWMHNTVSVYGNTEQKLNKSTKRWKNTKMKTVWEYWRFVTAIVNYPQGLQ
jgi:hypothetical protein